MKKKFLTKITPTAEHVFGLILLITRNYYQAIKSLDKGVFNRRPFGGYAMLSKLKNWNYWIWQVRKNSKKNISRFSNEVLYL